MPVSDPVPPASTRYSVTPFCCTPFDRSETCATKAWPAKTTVGGAVKASSNTRMLALVVSEGVPLLAAVKEKVSELEHVTRKETSPLAFVLLSAPALAIVQAVVVTSTKLIGIEVIPAESLAFTVTVKAVLLRVYLGLTVAES